MAFSAERASGLPCVSIDRASFMRNLALETKPRRAPETKPAETAKSDTKTDAKTDPAKPADSKMAPAKK